MQRLKGFVPAAVLAMALAATGSPSASAIDVLDGRGNIDPIFSGWGAVGTVEYPVNQDVIVGTFQAVGAVANAGGVDTIHGVREILVLRPTRKVERFIPGVGDPGEAGEATYMIEAVAPDGDTVTVRQCVKSLNTERFCTANI